MLRMLPLGGSPAWQGLGLLTAWNSFRKKGLASLSPLQAQGLGRFFLLAHAHAGTPEKGEGTLEI